MSARQPSQVSLWVLDTKDLVFTLVSQRLPFVPSGPFTVEYLYVEADFGNTDYVIVGGPNMKQQAGSVSLNNITTLSPGEWISFEPEEFTTSAIEGTIFDLDGQPGGLSVQLQSKVEYVDLSRFFGLSGPTIANQILHITTGVRTHI